MLTSKEQRHNRCLAEAAHQNGRPVPLHWHSHDFNPLEAHSSTTIFSMLLCLRIQFAHINTSLLMNLLSFLVSSCFFRLSLACSSSLKLYSAVVLHTSLVCTWVKKAKEERQCHWDKKRYYTVTKPEKTDAYTGNTHLQSHWDILLADIVVVLVSVQHNNCISQGKAGIAISKRRPVWFLKGK